MLQAPAKGEAIERDVLLSQVWGHGRDLFTRPVDMHIAKLRKKIEDRASDLRFLVTTHGAGHKWMA